MDGQFNNRGSFLTLALKARRVLDILILIEEGRSTPGDLAQLEAALDATQIEPSSGIAISRFLTSSYEEKRTIDEVANSERRRLLVGTIRSLIDGSGGPETEAPSLSDVISFFTNLEARALMNYDRTFQVPPATLTQLA